MTTENSITRQISCVDEHDPSSLPIYDALRRILNEIRPVSGYEKVSIRSALGRVLARDVCSPLDVPPKANAAMDGYALRGEDIPAAGTAALRLIGASFAGRPFHGTVGRGKCVRIMTGAVMPEGADTVIMQEHVRVNGDTIHIGDGHQAGQNVRGAGEDIAKGATALHAGRRITPADLGLLASLGLSEVMVRRRLRVAFFSTGDELRSIGEPVEAGAIYDSNRYTLYGMLTRLGAEIIDMGVVGDNPEDLRRAFLEATDCADMLITSGGVSVGEADFVTETLKASGTLHFWKVAMKPGQPLTFGHLSNTVFFGLPGNPVSVMATFYQLVRPALRRMMGEHEVATFTCKARCLTSLKKKPGRTEYQRGILGRDDEDNLTVRGTGPQGSGILTSMHQADCFIVLPAEWGKVAAGTIVDVQPFFGLV